MTEAERKLLANRGSILVGAGTHLGDFDALQSVDSTLAVSEALSSNDDTTDVSAQYGMGAGNAIPSGALIGVNNQFHKSWSSITIDAGQAVLYGRSDSHVEVSKA